MCQALWWAWRVSKIQSLGSSRLRWGRSGGGGGYRERQEYTNQGIMWNAVHQGKFWGPHEAPWELEELSKKEQSRGMDLCMRGSWLFMGQVDEKGAVQGGLQARTPGRAEEGEPSRVVDPEEPGSCLGLLWRPTGASQGPCLVRTSQVRYEPWASWSPSSISGAVSLSGPQLQPCLEHVDESCWWCGSGPFPSFGKGGREHPGLPGKAEWWRQQSSVQMSQFQAHWETL